MCKTSECKALCAEPEGVHMHICILLVRGAINSRANM